MYNVFKFFLIIAGLILSIVCIYNSRTIEKSIRQNYLKLFKDLLGPDHIYNKLGADGMIIATIKGALVFPKWAKGRHLKNIDVSKIPKLARKNLIKVVTTQALLMADLVLVCITFPVFSLEGNHVSIATKVHIITQSLLKNLF